MTESRDGQRSLRVLLRADAGDHRGTGHVMRCITLAEALVASGHDPVLAVNDHQVDWLTRAIVTSGIPVEQVAPDTLRAERLHDFDWLVVDSYTLDPATINQVAEQTPTLAIVDGDARGIDARLYLDQNLGAEERNWPGQVTGRMLAGSRFALIRDSVLRQRRPEPWKIRGRRPRIVAFFGGTDPFGVAPLAAESLSRLDLAMEVLIVAPGVSSTSSGDPRITVIPATEDLPTLLGSADIVVSAAGTSAWDICTLGIPAVLVALVDNQWESYSRAMDKGFTLGIEAIGDPAVAMESLGQLVRSLVDEENLRARLSAACVAHFDGLGKFRVVSAMEKALLTNREVQR